MRLISLLIDLNFMLRYKIGGAEPYALTRGVSVSGHAVRKNVATSKIISTHKTTQLSKLQNNIEKQQQMNQ